MNFKQFAKEETKISEISIFLVNQHA